MTVPKCLNTAATLAIATIVAITLALACGPAAPSGQQGEERTPTPKPDGIQTPTPTVDPTKEKEVEDKLRTAVYRTPTPKPSGDGEEKTTPTPDPDAEEPLPPTSTPIPTIPLAIVPTPSPNLYAGIVIDADFCFNVNLQDPSLHRARDKYDAASHIQVECSELVGRVIGERCYPDNGNPLGPDAKACVKRNADNIKDYVIRSSVYPECFSDHVQNDSQFIQCARQAGDNDNNMRAAAAQTRLVIRAVVDQNPTVVAAEKNAWICLEETKDKGSASQYVDTSRLLFWQNWTTEADAQRLSRLDESRLEKIREYMRLVDQCALKANVYQARHDALIAELRRYVTEETAKVEPWIKFGNLAALEEYGSEMLRP